MLSPAPLDRAHSAPRASFAWQRTIQHGDAQGLAGALERQGPHALLDAVPWPFACALRSPQALATLQVLAQPAYRPVLGQRVGLAMADGKAPLWLALAGERTRELTVLLQCGADPSTPNAQGWLPMPFAIWQGCAAVVALLQSFGASVRESSPEGKSPALLAVESRDPTTIGLVLGWTARPWEHSGAAAVLIRTAQSLGLQAVADGFRARERAERLGQTWAEVGGSAHTGSRL